MNHKTDRFIGTVPIDRQTISARIELRFFCRKNRCTLWRRLSAEKKIRTESQQKHCIGIVKEICCSSVFGGPPAASWGKKSDIKNFVKLCETSWFKKINHKVTQSSTRSDIKKLHGSKKINHKVTQSSTRSDIKKLHGSKKINHKVTHKNFVPNVWHSRRLRPAVKKVDPDSEILTKSVIRP
jgi:hypothetical protein